MEIYKYVRLQKIFVLYTLVKLSKGSICIEIGYGIGRILTQVFAYLIDSGLQPRMLLI